jgi:site-specific DNA-methyltransferase (adenine-specific)
MSAIRKEVVIGDCRLILGDCLSVLPLVGPVDHVISDPPFEVEAHTLRRRINRGKSRGGPSDVVSEEPLSFGALTEAQRNGVASWAASNCGGWFLAFCQAEAVSIWRDSLNSSGASYKRSMIWVKPDGMPQYSGDRPGMGYESIVAAWCGRGRSVWNGGGRHGVFVCNRNDADGGKAPHPTTKPRRLMRDLVELFTNQGETVLDPFMGSATTGIACVKLGRSFVGIELDPGYFDIACERIRKAYAQPDMFIAPRAPEPKQEAML